MVAANINENWGQCPKCGSPVLVNPNTGRAEPCANCLALSSKAGLFAGGYWIIAGLVVVASIVYFCLRLINR